MFIDSVLAAVAIAAPCAIVAGVITATNEIGQDWTRRDQYVEIITTTVIISIIIFVIFGSVLSAILYFAGTEFKI